MAGRISISAAHRGYRADIDGLRAVAVLLVLGFHAFPSRLNGGFIGVDIFFVISGFLISGIIFGGLRDASFSYAEFVIRRIKRIFPALLIVLASCMVVGWGVLLATEYQQLAKQIVAGAAFFSNFALWNESGYFDKAAELKPTLHLWSLGIEEQFYIFWPLLLVAAWKRGYDLFVVTLTVALLSFAICLVTTTSAPVAAFYSPLSRFWELLIGAGLAHICQTRPGSPSRSRDLQSIAGFLLILTAAFALNTDRAFPGWWALMPTIGAALMISGGPLALVNRILLANPVSVWIGKISYPLYLWHWPLLSFAWIVGDGLPSVRVRIGLLCLAVLLSALTYWIIEKPVRSKSNSFAVAGGLFAAMALVGTTGWLIYFDEGIKSRTVNGNPAGFDLDVGADDFRYEHCFLKENDRPSFPSSCDGDGTNVRRSMVLIWGDSHAHSLALGLASQGAMHDFRVAQFTSSACPPVLDFAVEARPLCRSINDSVARKIDEMKPHTVILAAFWYLFNGYDGYSLLDYEKMKATIDYLKQKNVKNIIVIGSLPTFMIDQPRVANEKFVRGTTDRTFYKLNTATAEINETIRSFAVENGVSFASPIDLLCNDKGCLISTSKEMLIPLAWDYAHLTRAGANYLFDAAVSNDEMSLP